MARPRWRGMLTLGLVSVPVYLYATADKKGTAPVGHNVHRKCMTKANTKKWCAKCDLEIPEDELMKGYDVADGKFVELTDDEVDSLKVESAKTIHITRVVDVAELEPLMVAETNFLISDGTAAAAEAEAVLLAALDGKLAVGTLALNGRERTVAVMVHRGGFVLHILRNTEAMKSLPERVPLPAPNPQMVELAEMLVASMFGPLDLSENIDHYALGLRNLVAAKFDGVELPAAPVQEPAKVFSLMDALKASVAAKAGPKLVEKEEKPAKKRSKAS